MPIHNLHRNCRQCGKPFVLPHGHAQGISVCSLTCRLEPKIDKSGGPDACWNWIAKARTQAGKGYGVLNVRGKLVGAHRAAFEAAWGVPPGDLMVCHRCDNVLCCNPAHLFLGTHRDNMRDMHIKGRNTMTPEGRARLIASKLGIPRSDECKAKMSAARRGKPSGALGITFSDAHRAKLRAAWAIRRARDFPHL